MARLLGEGLDAGALGISTSRTERHRTSRGENLGTLRAREPELQALASVLQSEGSRSLPTRFRQLPHDRTTTSPQSEFSLIAEIARASQRPVSFTVQQDFEAPERWRDLMASGRVTPRGGARRQGAGRATTHRRAARPPGVEQRVHPGSGLRAHRGTAARGASRRAEQSRSSPTDSRRVTPR